MDLVKRYHHELSWPEGFDMPSGEDLEELQVTRESIEKVGRCLSQIPLRYAEPVTLLKKLAIF